MRAHGYNVGGEQSGHIILSDYITTGDGFVAALQVLAVIRRQQKPVSQVCHRFEPLPQVLKNVRYKNGKPLENAVVNRRSSRAEEKLGRDGRLLVRPSGTEPVIRVMGEGDDKTAGRSGRRRHRRSAQQRRSVTSRAPVAVNRQDSLTLDFCGTWSPLSSHAGASSDFRLQRS